MIVSAVVVQAAVAPQLRLLGATPAVLVLVAVAGGVVGGAERGAAIGFASGLGMDVLVQTPFGLWGLTCTLVGWGTGHLDELVDATGPSARAVAAGVGTAVGLTLHVAIGSILGQRHLAGVPLGQLVVVLSIVNVVCMPLAHRALRWALGPGAGTPAR